MAVLSIIIELLKLFIYFTQPFSIQYFFTVVDTFSSDSHGDMSKNTISDTFICNKIRIYFIFHKLIYYKCQYVLHMYRANEIVNQHQFSLIFI